MAVLPRIHTGGKSKFSFVSLECKTSREMMLLMIVLTKVLFFVYVGSPVRYFNYGKIEHNVCSCYGRKS